MAAKLGLSCKIYYSPTSGTGASWTEITNVKNVKLDITSSEADVSTRDNGGYKAILAALKDASIDMEMVYDQASIGWQYIIDAYKANTVFGIYVADGVSSGTGVEGFKAMVQVVSCSIDQSLEDAVTASVKLKVAYSSVDPVYT